MLIGILAAMAITTYRMMINKARMTQAKTVLSHLTKTEATYFSDHDRYTDNIVLLDFDPVKYNYYDGFGGARQRRDELHGDRHGRRRHGGGPLVRHQGQGSRTRTTPPRSGRNGVDERIPLARIAEMTEIVYALIERWNAAR